ncbi:hypothetical protein I9P40_21845 [Citrobacter portucalensis]|uniref:hypothetical protein n=1 Tax=Citrobacter portucalensis TaxID=1639133 RepID=UPI0018E78C59|nr:hypothetical protein [Citrobacter portucalensis]UMB86634.1 hypothetical protein I9P40_21845 [Citrobacter portucalensis]
MEQETKIKAVKEIYFSLNTSQKMYINVLLFFFLYQFFHLISGFSELTRGFFFITMILWVLTIFYDFLALYKKIYAALLGKGVILLMFSLCTALAFSISGQVINDVVGVEPTRFTNSIIILSILTIPFIFSLIMGVLFGLWLVVLPLLVLYYFIFNHEVKRFLLPDMLDNQETMRFMVITRLIQFVSFAIFCGFIYSASHHVLNAYSIFMRDAATNLVFNLEMYEKSPCTLANQTRGVLIDDDHLLVARIVNKQHYFTLETCNYRVKEMAK